MKIINERRSVRSFLEKKVEKEKIISILKAAMQAPSAKNQQPWEFVVVENEEIKEKLSLTSQYTKFSKNAATLIVVLSRNNELSAKDFVQQDLGACIENLLLEVVNQNLGATWMGVYPNQERVEYVSNLLNLNKSLVPFALVALGYPKKENSNRFIDRFDNSRIHWVN
eukprot:Anaeramoba_ignava/a612767_28.p1 GENE.a612767_28~~a612767_28.p1  ORF type:complete len:168 (-),score=42.81 a612767_28:467-970(-)